MRRILSLAMGLFVGLLFLSACKSNSDIEEPTLELSTSTLTLKQEASEQTLTVQTNKEHWSAFSPTEGRGGWLTLRQEGQTLRVSAQANNGAEERSAVILVSAGGLQRRVDVRQAASTTIIELTTTHLTLPAEGGRGRIVYDTNADNPRAEVSASADWLSILYQARGVFTLEAKPNDGTLPRSAKVTLTAGAQTREVEVTQRAAKEYILPIQKFPATIQEVLRYEQDRSSSLTRSRESSNAVYFRYATQSSLMPLLEYEYESEQSRGYRAANVLCLDSKYLRGNETFLAFLQEQGYERVAGKSADQEIYKNKTLPINLTVVYDESGQALLKTTYSPRQDRAYPTFGQLPMTKLIPAISDRDRGIHGWKQAEVQRKEREEWHGVHNKGLSREGEYDRYDGGTSLDGEIARGYFYTVADENIPADDPFVGEVSTALAIYPNVTLAFWQDALGKYYLTDEVRALLQSKGYAYLRTLDGGYHLFYSTADKVALAIRPAMLQGKAVVEIQAYLIDLQMGSSARQRAKTITGATLLDRYHRLAQQIELRVRRTRILSSHH